MRRHYSGLGSIAMHLQLLPTQDHEEEALNRSSESSLEPSSTHETAKERLAGRSRSSSTSSTLIFLFLSLLLPLVLPLLLHVPLLSMRPASPKFSFLSLGSLEETRAFRQAPYKFLLSVLSSDSSQKPGACR